jgi:Protein of unknown function (DUF2846)
MYRAQMIFPLLILSLAVSGCATLGSAYTPEPAAQTDKATVYVYRSPGFVGGALSPTINANGVPLQDLPAGGYFVYHAAPGELEFSAKTEARTSVTVDAKAGQVYYVKGSIGVGVLVGHPHLVLVANDVGEREIAACKLAPATAPTAQAAAPAKTASKVTQ